MHLGDEFPLIDRLGDVVGHAKGEIFLPVAAHGVGRKRDNRQVHPALIVTQALDGFLAGLPAGVQIFALFEANPTLVELIVFIVVVSVGVVGLLSVSGPMLRNSADPMVRKQMTVIAESLLNEVMQQPYTYCDPDDANYLSATSAAGCTAPRWCPR